MPGGKTKSEVRPDGLLSSQVKVAGNSSRASSAMSEEDELFGYDGAQSQPWHPSSPRSASSRSNANMTNSQLPTVPSLRENNSSDDDGGATITAEKSPDVPGPGHEQDHASVNASESDVQDNPVGSEELEFSVPSEDPDGSMSEESIKSFGDEEYTPSQRPTGTRSQGSQKAQRVSTRGAKQNPVQTGSSKGRNHSTEREDTDDSGNALATSIGKVEAARGQPQKEVSQRTAKTALFEHSVDNIPTKQSKQHEKQGKRTLPFKRRIAKEPFTSVSEGHASKTSLSKAHAKDPASTDSNNSAKGKNIAQAQAHTAPQKGLDTTNSHSPFDIEGSSEPDVKPGPSAGHPRKTSVSRPTSQDARKFSQRQRAASNPKAAKLRNGKTTGKGTQEKPFDDIIDDDPHLSLSISKTKPNSKKRRSTPQSHGSAPKNPKSPDIELPFEDGEDHIAQSGSKDRTDPKQRSPDPNEVPIEISSDVSSSDVDEPCLQPGSYNSTNSPARQQKRQLTTYESSTLSRSVHPPKKKPKTSSASYEMGTLPLDQLNDSPSPDNDNTMAAADDDATRHNLESSSVGIKVHRAGDNKELAISQQKQTQIWNSKCASPMEKRATMLSMPVSKNVASNASFTGLRDPVKDKGSTNQHPILQAPAQHISYGPQPQDVATTPMIQPHQFTGTNAGVNRWRPLDTWPEASQSKPIAPIYYQPRIPQETHRYYEKPREQRPQPQRDGFSVQQAQARYVQPSPEQDFTAQLNPKTLDYNQKLASMPSLRHGNTHRQPFVISPPGQENPLAFNTTSTGPVTPEIQPQLGHRTRQDGIYVHEANTDHLRAMPSAENQRRRCDHLIHGASEGVATMLHDIVTVSYMHQSDVAASEFCL